MKSVLLKLQNSHCLLQTPFIASSFSVLPNVIMSLRILFIGDIVGKPGRRIVQEKLPELIDLWELDLVVANSENASGGSGLTVKAYREICDAGVDVITMGDHVYRKKEIYQLFEENTNLCKPANYPPESPGSDLVMTRARDGTLVGVFSVIGRLFMKPVDCPFRASEEMLNRIGNQTNCILIDFHAEATSEKQSLGRHLDGRASAVFGTHTHVATADEQIFPGGTAYQTDVGMTGPYDSILGRRIDRVVPTTINFKPSHFEVAQSDVRLSGALVEINPETGKAASVRRVAVSDSSS